jgi:hypothetical protein
MPTLMTDVFTEEIFIILVHGRQQKQFGTISGSRCKKNIAVCLEKDIRHFWQGLMVFNILKHL